MTDENLIPYDSGAKVSTSENKLLNFQSELEQSKSDKAEPLKASNFRYPKMLFESSLSEDRRIEPVLLLVRVEFLGKKSVDRLAERLNQLEEKVYPSDTFRRRYLLILSDRIDLCISALGAKAWKWQYFENFQDLYTKIMVRSYLYRSPDDWNRSFESAFYINVRGEDNVDGMLWGIQEGYAERCLLRVLLLAAKGNVLFGDWGWAMTAHPGITHEELKEMLIIPSYIYPETVRTIIEKEGTDERFRGIGFIKVLNHFLQPQSFRDSALSLENMERIIRARNAKLFDDDALTKALWTANFDLFFASDYYDLDYHRWLHFRRTQRNLVNIYIRYRTWFSASTWGEIFLDLILFSMTAVIFNNISSGIQQSVYFPVHTSLSKQPLRFVLWYPLKDLLWYKEIIMRHRMPPSRRLLYNLKVAITCGFLEPLFVFAAWRVGILAFAIGMVIGTVDQLTMEGMDRLNRSPTTPANIPVAVVAWGVTSIVFRQHVLQAAWSLLEGSFAWSFLFYFIALRIDWGFLSYYDLGWRDVRSFFILPGIFALMCIVVEPQFWSELFNIIKP